LSGKKKIDYFRDKDYKIILNRCDICDERLQCRDNIESHIDMLNEINDSYIDEYDKKEPRLLLCGYCQKEYMIQAYPI